MGLPGLLRALIASLCLGKAGKDDRQQTQPAQLPCVEVGQVIIVCWGLGELANWQRN